MAAPYPPAGNQQQHTERPLKIYGEQYLASAPLPVGVVIDPPGTVDPDGVPGPPLFTDGLPRVLLPSGWIVVNITDWVISNRYTGAAQEVISADEFTERFGPSE